VLHWRILAFAASAFLILALIRISDGIAQLLVGYRIEAFVALASAGLVLLASLIAAIAPPAVAVSSVFKWIGAPLLWIYLIHLPVFGICQESGCAVVLLGGLSDPGIFCDLGPLLTVVSLNWNFRFLETPLRKVGVRIANGSWRRARRSHRHIHESVAAERDTLFKALPRALFPGRHGGSTRSSPGLSLGFPRRFWPEKSSPAQRHWRASWRQKARVLRAAFS